MAMHEFRAVADAGIDCDLHETYRRVAPENRIRQAIGRAGRPMADWMVMPKSELVGSPLQTESFAPRGFHGVMAAPILARDSLSGSSSPSAAKSRSDFAEEDLDLLANFAPHLGRAVGLRIEREMAFAELNANRQILDDTEDPVLRLDSGLRAIHVNALAASLLDRGDRLRLRHWRLVARHPDDNARLQAVFARRPCWADRRRRISPSFTARSTARFSSRRHRWLRPARTVRFPRRVGLLRSGIPSGGVSPTPQSCNGCSG
jgi:hypothetical protein